MTIREKLVDAIMNLSSEEFEHIHAVMELAKESEDELIERIISIAEYYRDNQ